MSSISSVTPPNNYGNTSSATVPAESPVAQTSDSGLAQTAVSLASEAGVVATLGGVASSAVTYDAAGLLNSLAHAGVALSSTPPAANSYSPQSAQNSTDQGVVSALPADPASSGIYNSSGSLPPLPSNTSANWASALKADPSLASAAISDSVQQSIVQTLSVIA